MAVLIIAFFLVKVFTLLLHFLLDGLISFVSFGFLVDGSWWAVAWPNALLLSPLPNLNKAYY